MFKFSNYTLNKYKMSDTENYSIDTTYSRASKTVSVEAWQFRKKWLYYDKMKTM
mgnify:CR=1 FL=1|tara:strand:+ start:352 stop:513 length:162 start_codon:yes stop_codon:yes gene_type:complete